MKLAIFDLDGTLVDSMSMWKTVSTNYLWNKFNIKVDYKLQNKLNTLSFTNSIKFLVEEFKLNAKVDDILDELGETIKKAYKETIPLKSGAIEYLEYLKDKNVKMCVATACEKYLAEIVCKRLGILDYIEFIITVDEIKKTKMEPDIFLYCADKFNISIDESTVFEDSFFAMKAAKSVGFNVVAIKDVNYNKERETINRNSDLQIETFFELMN